MNPCLNQLQLHLRQVHLKQVRLKQVHLKLVDFRLADLRQALIQAVLVSTVATAGVLTGLVPNIGVAGLEFSSQADAQSRASFTNEEITNYARAVLALEARRHQVFNEIKKIVGSVPRIVCNERSSIEALPGATPQQLATSYCEQAEKIVEMKGLTITRFNEITDRQQTDPQLRQKIQTEIQRVQQSPER